MLIRNSMPEFYGELLLLLTQSGEAEVESQMHELRIVERCRCNDNFCSSFYTAPKPVGAYGPGHRCLALSPVQGMITLDLVDGRIMQVEVLFRDEVRTKLYSLLP